MKDLYSFDADPLAAMESYKKVQEAYRRIFETIGIPFTVVSHFSQPYLHRVIIGLIA